VLIFSLAIVVVKLFATLRFFNKQKLQNISGTVLESGSINWQLIYPYYNYPYYTLPCRGQQINYKILRINEGNSNGVKLFKIIKRLKHEFIVKITSYRSFTLLML
jgi:hypothetical protein